VGFPMSCSSRTTSCRTFSGLSMKEARTSCRDHQDRQVYLILVPNFIFEPNNIM
jgi:hypothetical protein